MTDKAMQPESKPKISTTMKREVEIDPNTGALRFPCDTHPPLSKEWQTCQVQEASGEKRAVIINRSDNLKQEIDKVCSRETGQCSSFLSGYRRDMQTALSFTNTNNAFSSGNYLQKSCVAGVTGFSSTEGITRSPQGWTNNLDSPNEAISFARVAMLHEGYHCHPNNQAPDKVQITYKGDSLNVDVNEDEKRLYNELWADTRTALHLRSLARGYDLKSDPGRNVTLQLAHIFDTVKNMREHDEGDHHTAQALERVSKLSTEEITAKRPTELDALAKNIAMTSLQEKVSSNYSSSFWRRWF